MYTSFSILAPPFIFKLPPDPIPVAFVVPKILSVVPLYTKESNPVIFPFVKTTSGPLSITGVTGNTSFFKVRVLFPSGYNIADHNIQLMKLIKKVVLLWALLFAAPAIAAPSNFLVSTDWLEKNLNNPKLRIIEVSVDTGVYERGHIQGAVNFKWHTDLVDTVKRDIASKENFEKLLRQAGINNDSTIVIYGDSNNWFAAWGAWVFDIYGVKDVKLLDGGRKKWEAEKRPLTPLATQVAAGNIKVSDANNNLRAKLIDVVAVANKKSDTALVDIRSSDEFTGKVIAPAGVQELAKLN